MTVMIKTFWINNQKFLLLCGSGLLAFLLCNYFLSYVSRGAGFPVRGLCFTHSFIGCSAQSAASAGGTERTPTQQIEKMQIMRRRIAGPPTDGILLDPSFLG